MTRPVPSLGSSVPPRPKNCAAAVKGTQSDKMTQATASSRCSVFLRTLSLIECSVATNCTPQLLNRQISTRVGGQQGLTCRGDGHADHVQTLHHHRSHAL